MNNFIKIFEGEISKGLKDHGISNFEPLVGKESAVGYLFHPKKGFIFILPKIYKNKSENVDPLTIYRVLKRYDEDYRSLHTGKTSDSTKTVDTSADIMLRSEDEGKNSDILDIILQLFRFNRENRHFIITELNQIRGYHRIDWRRTIRNNIPAILDGEVAYFNPISRKREVNNTESLLVLFYSILNYLHIKYPNLSQRYEPEFYLDIISPELLEQYTEGGEDCQGLNYLNRIRSRYFSDKALRLWKLCHAFFSKMASISEGTGKIDYLLASKFNNVFERMVDDLLSDNELKGFIMSELEKHGRYLDHIYKYEHPLTKEEGYFIGDSKYYMDASKMENHSIYKQFDYANYFVQALFDKGQRDEVYNFATGGYLPIINFFIRGGVEIDGEIDVEIKQTIYKDHSHTYWQCHFKDRLFDRNTQLVLDFTINFDMLVTAYIEKGHFHKMLADKVKNVVAKEYKKQITKDYNILTAKTNLNSFELKDRCLIGKIFLTKGGRLLLSLKKPEQK